jgi:hypothetical protein
MRIRIRDLVNLHYIYLFKLFRTYVIVSIQLKMLQESFRTETKLRDPKLDAEFCKRELKSVTLEKQ